MHLKSVYTYRLLLRVRLRQFKGAFILERKRKRKRRRFQSVALIPIFVFILQQFPSESESDVAFAS